MLFKVTVEHYQQLWKWEGNSRQSHICFDYTVWLLSWNEGNATPNTVQRESECIYGYFDASGNKDSEQIHCVEEELHNSKDLSSAIEP